MSTNLMENLAINYYRMRDRGSDIPRSKWIVVDTSLRDEELAILQILGLDKKVIHPMSIYPLNSDQKTDAFDANDSGESSISTDTMEEMLSGLKKRSNALKKYFLSHGQEGGVVITYVKDSHKLSDYVETCYKNRAKPYVDPVPKPFSIPDYTWFLIEDLVVVTHR